MSPDIGCILCGGSHPTSGCKLGSVASAFPCCGHAAEAAKLRGNMASAEETIAAIQADLWAADKRVAAAEAEAARLLRVVEAWQENAAASVLSGDPSTYFIDLPRRFAAREALRALGETP